MAYDNTNTGALFINDKGDNEKRPDYRGKVNIEGTEYSVSGWKRTSQTGKPYLSLRLELAREDYGKAGKPDHAKAAASDFDDDIPF